MGGATAPKGGERYGRGVGDHHNIYTREVRGREINASDWETPGINFIFIFFLQIQMRWRSVGNDGGWNGGVHGGEVLNSLAEMRFVTPGGGGGGDNLQEGGRGPNLPKSLFFQYTFYLRCIFLFTWKRGFSQCDLFSKSSPKFAQN